MGGICVLDFDFLKIDVDFCIWENCFGCCEVNWIFFCFERVEME